MIINIAIFAIVFALTDISYETNDDFAIARELADGYPYVGFVNYFLCKIIITIQYIIPGWNAFVLSQIAGSFLSFTILLKIILDRNRFLPEIILAISVCTIFSLDHYSSIQFTKTAALMMTVGLVQIADNYIHERTIAGFIFSFMLYFAGVAFRQKAMLPAIAFLGAFMLIWWAQNFRDVFGGVGAKRELATVAMILVFILIPYGVDKVSDHINESTPELKLAREYQAERRLITDYPLMDYYEANREAYEELGFSENDLYLMDRWIFDYDGAASLENMRHINEINSPYIESVSLVKAIKRAVKNSVKSVPNITFTGSHIIIVGLIAIYIMICRRRETRIFVLAIGIITFTIYIAVYYIQRPQYRALYVADESAAFWLIYASAVSQQGCSNKTKITSSISTVISILVLCMLIPAIPRLDAQKEHNEAQIMPSKLIEYFEVNEKNFFIGPTTSMGMSPGFDTPLKSPTTIRNMSDTGGWDTLSPYKLDQFSNYGIQNPVRDLINSPNAVYVGNSKHKILKEYFNKWYCENGETIRFQKIDEVGGTGIYKVLKN